MVGYFCAALCSAVLSLTPNVGAYDEHSTETVRFLGVPIGRWVDDSQPRQCDAVTAEKAAGVPIVLAGVAPKVGSYSCEGALMVREWYPFGCQRHWGRMPAASAYVLQGSFAWPGCRPPTRAEQRAELRGARAHHPLLILWYSAPRSVGSAVGHSRRSIFGCQSPASRP